MQLVLQGGRVYCSTTGVDGVGDVWVQDGTLLAIYLYEEGTVPKIPDSARVIDCVGKWVAPGLVDLRTFCGELGVQHRENFDSLTRAALAGGYTNVVLGPWGAPCVDNPAVVTDLLARSAKYPVRYHALGALTVGLKGVELAEMGLMKRAGIIGVCDGNQPLTSSVVLRRSMQYAQRLGLPLFLTPSDPDLDLEGVMHEGVISAKVGLAGIPLASEQIGIQRILALQQDTHARCCILPVGSSHSLPKDQIQGDCQIAISARSLILSDTSIDEDLYNPSLHIYPPLRDDPQGLASETQKGAVSMIFSHHVPLTRVEQDCEFSMSLPGAMGIETALSTAHTVLQDLPMIWEKMCFAPAQFLGLDKGLHLGADLDIVIFDPTEEWCPKLPFQSKGINEPIVGKKLIGRVCRTLTKEVLTFEAQR